ncbi:hypothetical protein I1E95_10115 [Synechococcus sp. CBW1107]|uniref:hypothetical protein n=1 Tax=Synechococcus sp. CBW1107 TaxID=2789857 RepID=UPI0018CEE630|nr:hypothetical protein [Synechococcus sp. CBW1107]QPN55564.1 hypothetical protein I1E95_10115 [Synechococcus sp. CBW1107]
MLESPSGPAARQPVGIALTGLWLLIAAGLVLRLWQAPTAAGHYDLDVDTYLHLGRRLLHGRLMYEEGFNAKWPIIQVLYAPSAWLGSIRAHRMLTLLLNLGGGLLLALAIRQLARGGLLPLRDGSLVPVGGAVLYVTMSQKMLGGLSGHLHQFANAFLVVALAVLALQLPSTRRAGLAAVGFCLFLSVAVRPNLLLPLLLVTLTLLPWPGSWSRRRRLSGLGWLTAGAGLGAVLMGLPYLGISDGPARLWAGAVLLPLEWSAQRPGDHQGLGELFRQVAGASVAGVELWMLLVIPLLGVVSLARQARRGRGGSSARSLMVPLLSLVFLGGLILSFSSTHFWRHYVLMAIVPVVLIVASGMAALERSSSLGLRRTGTAFALALSLILVNNVFVAEILAVGADARAADAVEVDRERLIQQLRTLKGEAGTFTSPQDFSLHWQLDQPSSTVGVHPSWSLDPYGMRRSWATDRIGLAISDEQACAQLTDPRHRHLIWTRTGRGGRHSEDFLLECLNRDEHTWREITQDMGLTSGAIRVFRRTP